MRKIYTYYSVSLVRIELRGRFYQSELRTLHIKIRVSLIAIIDSQALSATGHAVGCLGQ